MIFSIAGDSFPAFFGKICGTTVVALILVIMRVLRAGVRLLALDNPLRSFFKFQKFISNNDLGVELLIKNIYTGIYYCHLNLTLRRSR